VLAEERDVLGRVQAQKYVVEFAEFRQLTDAGIDSSQLSSFGERLDDSNKLRVVSAIISEENKLTSLFRHAVMENPFVKFDGSICFVIF